MCFEWLCWRIPLISTCMWRKYRRLATCQVFLCLRVGVAEQLRSLIDSIAAPHFLFVGLVFEDHVPQSSGHRLLDLRTGAVQQADQRRNALQGQHLWRRTHSMRWCNPWLNVLWWYHSTMMQSDAVLLLLNCLSWNKAKVTYDTKIWCIWVKY